MKMQKIISVVSVMLFAPISLWANGGWELHQNKNRLVISGFCFEKQVKFDLYEKNKGEAVYTSGVLCKDGKFEFSDNLLQWKSLKDGEYELVVNGDEKNVGKVEIARPVEKSVVAIESAPVVTAKTVEQIDNVPVDPETKFLNAFVSLQQTILDMREWLGQTNYPEILKSSISLGLDGLDLAVGKVSDLVLSFQDTGNVTTDKAPEKVKEIQEAVAQDVVVDPVVTADDSVKLDSMIVPEVKDAVNVPVIDVSDSALTVE